MFTTKEEIKQRTGVDVDQQNIQIAQLMIEAWIGRSESEVTDAEDLDALGRALTFQAVYIGNQSLDILEQVAIKRLAMGDSVTEFDTERFGPYMSPWAVMACKRLSWMSTRTVHTGPIFDRRSTLYQWETT